MFVEPSAPAPLRKVLSDCLLSLPILSFPLEDDPSDDLDVPTLFPYPDASRSAIHVAAVPVSVQMKAMIHGERKVREREKTKVREHGGRPLEELKPEMYLHLRLQRQPQEQKHPWSYVQTQRQVCWSGSLIFSISQLEFHLLCYYFILFTLHLHYIDFSVSSFSLYSSFFLHFAFGPTTI